MKLNTQQVGRVGEHSVAAELHRRGAYAVTFSGNMPSIDILASDLQQTRTVAIQVKTKITGTWHTTILRGEPRDEPEDEDRFWILVDVGRDSELPPAYWIVPEWWMVNHIHVRYNERLAAHGGAPAPQPGLQAFRDHPQERRAVAKPMGSAADLLILGRAAAAQRPPARRTRRARPTAVADSAGVRGDR